MRGRPRTPALLALAAVATTTLLLVVAGPAGAATRSCGSRERLYAPKAGGFALIISRLRVSRITCVRAVKIAGAASGGEGLPAGWHCHSAPGGRSVCSWRRVVVSWIFGGDAG
jgi:hypothetical protein